MEYASHWQVCSTFTKVAISTTDLPQLLLIQLVTMTSTAAMLSKPAPLVVEVMEELSYVATRLHAAHFILPDPNSQLAWIAQAINHLQQEQQMR